MSKILVVVGNGLSIDRTLHAKINYLPQSPLGWPIPNPDSSTQLIDALLNLKEFIGNQDLEHTKSNYEVIRKISSISEGKAGPWEWGDSEGLNLHSEMRHYLILAYSWYQTRLDRTRLDNWHWHQWLGNHRKSISAVLSFNYDLVIERSLYWNRVPFFYPTAENTEIQLGRPALNAIPIVKPHGSCNFGTVLDIRPIGYPIPTHTWAADAPLRIIKDDKLLSARGIADIVIPGEWSSFGMHLDWVNKGYRAIKTLGQETDKLIIIGFSYSTCDREEFDALVKMLPQFKKILIADPNPSEDLIDILRSKSKEILLWKSGPANHI